MDVREQLIAVELHDVEAVEDPDHDCDDEHRHRHEEQGPDGARGVRGSR
jgi:hypothetical protein